ncbi:unnamed protein product [Sphagnum jensenii]|uniref:Uncharacterized protein n=1 Tax=Sphagnum jensenii TaxID=128206 RepID=A0ABP1AP63_9BRYO
MTGGARSTATLLARLRSASTLAMLSDRPIVNRVMFYRTIVFSLVSIASECACAHVLTSSTYSRSVANNTNELSWCTYWTIGKLSKPPGRCQDGLCDVANLLLALVEECDDARRTGDVKLEHRSEREPPVHLLRACFAHLGDQVRLLVKVRGQGVCGLERGAIVDLVDRHVNDQVELVRHTPDLNDFELGAPHHVDLDAVDVTHVGLHAVCRDADQLARPPDEQRAEQFDEHGLLVGGRVAIEVRHGDQMEVLQDTVHTDMDANVEERRAAMLAAVKRYHKCPQVVAGQDVIDELQGMADQDSHVLFDDRVVEAVELGNFAGVFGCLIVIAICRNDRPHDTCRMVSLKRMSLLMLTV